MILECILNQYIETNEENELEFKLTLTIEKHQGLGHINMTKFRPLDTATKCLVCAYKFR